MATARQVESFLSEEEIAVVGASRSGGKFGNMVISEMGEKGYTLYPIHPESDTVGGVKSYRSYSDLPNPVAASFIAVAPDKCATAVREAHAAGVNKVWIQQMSQSQEAIDYCESHGIEAVTRECIFMFAEPVGSIHKFHRFFKKLFGRMPSKETA